ncbi:MULTISPECIES: TIGR02452 family protein [Paenibacillus]|uniref:TIGR02452 family protein n=1 Tax=Paenibacillus TaxID=44249 RepID=UPI00187B4C67|nr:MULTISPECIES: TIGR02452 family protein [Paenibacillus]MBE7681250.1 TIGR02452 family protein [Paenibacillus sp. P13VS]MBY0215934.1 TIGR02452 family protein [Paenibacillus illinoisensis]
MNANQHKKNNQLKSTNQRSGRARIAQETLAILEEGQYINGYDRRVSIDEDLKRAIQGSVLYRPDELPALREQVRQLQGAPKSAAAKIEVTGETTLAAASRLVVEEGRTDVVCLNFASAKNPGGGFLGGSQAQEESLARASGLYPCISQMNEMYDHNRKLRTCLYSDYMIYSPGVPVIRDDEDRLLAQYYTTSFITAPAVNAGVVKEREQADDQQIESVMKERIRYILDVAAMNGHRTLVLGAYGCGVFRNDPMDVARYFHDVLVQENFRQSFERIVFAVLDRSAGQRIIKAFQEQLL